MRLDWIISNPWEDWLSEGVRKSGSGFEERGISASYLSNAGIYIFIVIILVVFYIFVKIASLRVFKCSLKLTTATTRFSRSILEWGFFIDIINFVTVYFVCFGFLNYVSLDLNKTGGIIGLILAHLGWMVPCTLAIFGIRYVYINHSKLYNDFEILKEDFWDQSYTADIGSLNTTFKFRTLWYLLRSDYKMQSLYLLLQIVRKIIFGIVMVAVTNSPMA